MFNRLTNNRFGVTIFGAVILTVAIGMLSQTEVTCGGRTMKPGDECVETRKGDTTTRTYDEQKQHDTLIAWGALLAGAAMTVGGLYRIVTVARRRRQEGAAAEPVAQAQAAWGQQQGGAPGWEQQAAHAHAGQHQGWGEQHGGHAQTGQPPAWGGPQAGAQQVWGGQQQWAAQQQAAPSPQQSAPAHQQGWEQQPAPQQGWEQQPAPQQGWGQTPPAQHGWEQQPPYPTRER